MKLYQALKEFEIRDGELTKEDLKKLFKKLALINHPDKGGDTIKMQNILDAYEVLKDQYSFVSNSKDQDHFEEDVHFWDIDDEDMKKAYLKICNIEGLSIEICGFWMWVTGQTYSHKKELKEAGLYYASKKQAWYWKPADYVSYSNGKTTLEEIRKAYGSKGISGQELKMIKGA